MIDHLMPGQSINSLNVRLQAPHPGQCKLISLTPRLQRFQGFIMAASGRDAGDGADYSEVLPSMLLNSDELHRHGFSGRTGGRATGALMTTSARQAQQGSSYEGRSHLPRRKYVPEQHSPRPVSPVKSSSPRGAHVVGDSHPHNSSRYDEYRSLKPATAPPVKPPAFAGPNSPRLSVAQPRVARFSRRRIVRPGAQPVQQ